MTSSHTFDHAVIVVPSLDIAIDNFQSLGFNVQRGGANGPTHNALIYFRDGTYIELITPIRRPARILFRALHTVGLLGLIARRQPGIMPRFMMWFGAPAGLRDWCVRCTSLDNTIEQLRSQGIETSDANKFSRKRPDGEVAKWRLAGPLNTQLPFLIEDITPTEIRVPFEHNSDHSNGVTGIAVVIISGDTQVGALEKFQALVSLGQEDGAVTIRSEKNQPAGIALELISNTELKGPLAPDKTFGAQLTLV